MQVTVRCTPTEVDAAVRDLVTSDVTAALKAVCTVGDQFIVNPTVWYGVNENGDVRPRVVNSAGFLSKKFEHYLKDERGWASQKKLEDQTIDAYREVDSHSPGFQLERSAMFHFLDEYSEAHPELSPDTVAVMIYQKYVQRTCFNLNGIPRKYHHYFQRAATTRPIKVGLEFETGNIASSFRALMKLGFLYRRGKIDAGVFITSRDKETTARIWPVSNRNASFVELERRNYSDSIFYSSWEFAFAPDGVDVNAKYLANGGDTYVLEPTGETVSHGGIDYEECKKGKQLLLRRKSQPST